jgi:hypothetical protein
MNKYMGGSILFTTIKCFRDYGINERRIHELFDHLVELNTYFRFTEQTQLSALCEVLMAVVGGLTYDDDPNVIIRRLLNIAVLADIADTIATLATIAGWPAGWAMQS